MINLSDRLNLKKKRRNHFLENCIDSTCLINWELDYIKKIKILINM